LTGASGPRPGGPDHLDLMSVDDARTTVLAVCAPLPAVAVSLADALGLVLAEEIIAARDVPPFANSAMDGFACRAADLAPATPASPVLLQVIATVMAGDAPGAKLQPGCAIRIMTGAPVPAGADAVVAFERADADAAVGECVRIRHALPRGTNIRAAGEDIHAGQPVLLPGRRIRPAEIALLAANGRATIAVHRRPRVAILATGNEVVAPGETPGPGQIWDSNSAAIAAMTRQAGGIPVPLGIARDNESEIRARLTSEPEVDLFVTSGGVSAGDFDLIKEILRQDARIEFWQIRIKPGRPLAFGSYAGVPLLGLPGNPVAAMVTFLQFVRPAILTLLGRTDLELPRVMARMLDRVENGGRRRQYVRVRLTETPEGYEARLAGSQGSAILSTLAEADGLLVIPETMTIVEPGAILPVELPD
jgi:molybdopterin molybdotransferase